MKELDFDELDRAVNTLMSGASSVQPTSDEKSDTPTTIDIPSTITDEQPKLAPALPPEPLTNHIDRPVVHTAMPAARRGGRFMDVVHPSSDMKSQANVPARPVSRQGTTISPTLAPKKAEHVVDKPPVEEVAVAEEPTWPDPLDMVAYQREPDTATTPQVEISADEETPAEVHEIALPGSEPIPADQQPTSALVDEQPLSTPFLSDAKIEKRPLGMNSVEEPDHAPTVNAAPESDTPNAESQLPAEPDSLVPVVLPAELQSDVLSIESDKSLTAHLPREVSSESAAATEQEDETTESVGPASIQQQYKEQPSTGDQGNGGIYDTENIHQPLVHPAKKTASWTWVIWILLLLVLGAAGGAGAYLYLK